MKLDAQTMLMAMAIQREHGGGGGDITTQSLSVSANGTYTAPSGKAYTPVNVNVPNTYAAGDEGKVVSNGALASQTSVTKTANGTYDTTTNNEVVVNVQPVLQDKTVTENGTVTADLGYDALSTVTVNVSAEPVVQSLSVTQNGTYTPPSGVDGYAPVTVNVSGGGGPSLPSEYQEVEYVSMTGDQYAVMPNLITFEVSDIIYVKVAKLATTNYPTVIGSHKDANLTTGVWEYYFGNDTRGLDVYGDTFSSTIIKTASTAVIDEPVIGIMYLPNAPNNTYKSVYFALGKYRSYPSNVKIYRVIVYRYGTTNLNIFMNFIPCYRKADGEIGFYELVSGTFLTNAGSGTFGKGPDAN